MINKEDLIGLGFGKETGLIEKLKCPFCSKKIDIKTEFNDDLSRREQLISQWRKKNDKRK